MFCSKTWTVRTIWKRKKWLLLLWTLYAQCANRFRALNWLLRFFRFSFFALFRRPQADVNLKERCCGEKKWFHFRLNAVWMQLVSWLVWSEHSNRFDLRAQLSIKYEWMRYRAKTARSRTKLRKKLIEAIIHVIRDANSKFTHEIEIEFVCTDFFNSWKLYVRMFQMPAMIISSVIIIIIAVATDRRQTNATHTRARRDSRFWITPLKRSFNRV